MGGSATYRLAVSEDLHIVRLGKPHDGRSGTRRDHGHAEQTRLRPAVPMKMKLADHTTAMLPLPPTGTAGALVVRAPVIIAALREYFELLWDWATPLKASRPAEPGDRLTPGQRKVAGVDGPRPA